jgi:para-aminobenzoate synthetase component 1
MPAPVVPLVEELIPCPDPWDVARKLAHLPHLLFLDSSERGGDRGRYSYVTADPVQFMSGSNPDEVIVVYDYGYTGPFCKPLEYEEQLVKERSRTEGHLPPFQGGLAGLLNYELGRQIEAKVPPARQREFFSHTSQLGLYDTVISFDHQQGRAWIVSSGLPSYHRYGKETAARRLKWFRWNLTRELPPRVPPQPWSISEGDLAPQYPLPDHPTVTSNFSRDGYIAAVRRAVEYVHAGDVFQVNLSQRLLAPLTEHPLDLYGRLRRVSPAPFGCYFDLGDFQIASASPERFLQVSSSGEVSTRPIKGTRPRGKTPAEDAELLRDLTTNPKDRAENVMIVDLLRNDLGRVCEYGSVKVPIVCEVESFRQVHHLVSEVRGKLRPGMTAFDLLRAAFPGGSVTGAPKVRAMEIIAELEPTARGPYCGSVGWIGFDGAMDTNILIRTFTAGRGWLQFPVGGGIVADSDPATEYEETLHKAAGLLKALKP